MGVFNYLTIVMPCPKCGQMLDSWQSKSLTVRGLLLANVMESIDMADDIYGEADDICSNCRSFLNVEIRAGKPGKIRASPLPPPGQTLLTHRVRVPAAIFLASQRTPEERPSFDRLRML